jgi:membrane associated rhomboid family serine protease
MRYRSYQRWGDTTVLLLIAINIVLFIARLANDSLIDTLGLAPATWTSEPWTLLTSMFMHASFWHIIFNMLALYFLGSSLCRLIGDKWFLTVYFLGGIAGGFFFVLLGEGTAIGASGAIFAVGAAFAVIAPKLRVIVFPIPAPVPLWAAILGIFVILTVIPIFYSSSNIAWEAHLGGFILGLVLGYYLRRKQRKAIIWSDRLFR